MYLSLSLTSSALYLTCFLGYLVLVRALRWRRYNEIHLRFGPKIKDLSFEEAQHIVNFMGMYEMPLLMYYSLSLALFKTYAIPSISRLLESTKQLSSSELWSRRYADTEILIATMVNCPVSGRRVQDIPIRIDERTDKEFDPRAMIAVSRINYIHSHYKISNDDYLYTLSVFITEPITWAQRYGWRPMSALERQAFFVYWKGIGELMNIRDIPETLEDLTIWVKEYEANYQKPTESNQNVANYTIDGLLSCVPKSFGMRNFFRKLVVCILEVPVADAMLQPRQPWYLHALVETALKSIGYFMLHFLPPRSSSNPQSIVPLAIPENRYMWPNHFAPRPWYKPARIGLGWFLDRLTVAIGLYEDIPGPEYKCEGYHLESMGPILYENSGHNEVMENVEKVLGCPITGVFALKNSNQLDKGSDSLNKSRPRN